MTLIPVFCGPSLPPEARPRGPFDWRPPARAGDLLALAAAPPDRLCLIDGYFDWCPAPWHKELLLLMARGTIVLGASSMGALRAAELHAYGMIGVGAIFRAYRTGRLSGDDEVALIHAPAELGWAPLSLPSVELRATLVAACRAGLIRAEHARTLRERARRIHYEDRDWPAVERAWLELGILDRAAIALIRTLYVPLKRQDALACLETVLDPVLQPPVRPTRPPVTCFMRDLAGELGLDPAMLGSR
ncbi:TfuA-like protein [Sphingosinicella terrae]|uniref:TfuA-like protein n=1 Tax=Sphingosinicella terrae TaxID=2172047 RepID=UPI000E0DF12B|nr:TfuA domain-containing protein [Sphingosinicella terrae]